MAAPSSHGGPGRSSHVGNGREPERDKDQGKKSPGKPHDDKNRSHSEARDGSDEICGFHPLRYLRNIFFGHFKSTTPRSSGSRTTDARSPSPTKAKSSDDITNQTRRGGDPEYSQAPIVASDSPHPPTRPPRKKSKTQSTGAMGKQLSVSADNLISPDDWIPAPHGIPNAVNSPAAATSPAAAKSDRKAPQLTIQRTGNVDEVYVTEPEDDSFFSSGWLQVGVNRTRAFSSGDADESELSRSLDLDSIRETQTLDVSIVKDRMFIKPKGKKLTTNLQEKVKKTPDSPGGAAGPAPIAARKQLQSLTEVDESEDKDAQKETVKDKDRVPSVRRESAPRAHAEQTTAEEAAPVAVETPKPDTASCRRERATPLSDRSGYRMTIGMAITPDMLTGALRKPGDRKDVRARAGLSTIESGPALDISRKRKPAPLAPGEPDKKPPETDQKKEEDKEGDAKNNDTAARCSQVHPTNDATGGPSTPEVTGGRVAPRRPVLAPSLSYTEQEAEKDFKGARPKEPPPKPRPKPRPKTVMHPGDAPTNEELGAKSGQRNDAFE